MKTLVIVSHPYPEYSHVIKALKETAESMVNVVVRDLEAIYATRDIVLILLKNKMRMMALTGSYLCIRHTGLTLPPISNLI